MWKHEPTDDYLRRQKRYEKNHPAELKRMLDNLDTYKRALDAGAKPGPKHFGFVHPEPMGVVAIDQRGGGGKLKQTRLYIYPDVATGIIYGLTIGDKTTQQEDIARCKGYVTQLRKEASDAQKNAVQQRNSTDASDSGERSVCERRGEDYLGAAGH